MAAQKGGVIGVHGEDASIGRWIACSPAFYLLIDERTNGVFIIGSLVTTCHDAYPSCVIMSPRYEMSGLIIGAITLRGTDTRVASIAGCSAFWSKKNTIASLVIAKLW